MKYLRTKGSFKTGKNYFDVEKIISRKVEGKNKFYLIKWVGFPLADCSWEPISHLHNVIDMVETFEQNFPDSIDKRRLKKYLYVINQKGSHIIRIKNPFLEKRGYKNKRMKKKENIIICIDNSTNLNKKDEECKEEEKEIQKENEETEISIENFNDLNKKEDKQNLKINEISNELNTINSDENNNKKLIKPILIW